MNKNSNPKKKKKKAQVRKILSPSGQAILIRVNKEEYEELMDDGFLYRFII